VYEHTRRAKLRRGYQPALFSLAASCDAPASRDWGAVRKDRTSYKKPTPPQGTSARQQELFSR
jgi:hypothetical protein